MWVWTRLHVNQLAFQLLVAIAGVVNRALGCRLHYTDVRGYTGITCRYLILIEIDCGNVAMLLHNTYYIHIFISVLLNIVANKFCGVLFCFDWQTTWLLDWMTLYWLADTLCDKLTDWFVRWYLIGWLNDWIIDCHLLSDWLTDWLDSCVTSCRRLIGWQTECVCLSFEI